MRAILLICLAGATLAGCGGGSSEWNPQSAAELKTKLEQMFKDIDTGNFAGMKLWADKDVVMFDLDESNSPVAMRGADALDKYLASLVNATKEKGVAFKTTISRDDCLADSDMGFCTVEFDQTLTQGGQTAGPFKFRGSLIAHRTKDGWKWVHWHGSFREFPPTATGASATTRAGGRCGAGRDCTGR